jgi:hypothetical protein
MEDATGESSLSLKVREEIRKSQVHQTAGSYYFNNSDQFDAVD